VDEYDAIVVGGGPAGLTAATYLRRFHRSCLVVDAGDSRARRIPQSHNCPGFPYGVSGVELLERMRRQAVDVGARFQAAWVDEIVERDGRFIVSGRVGRWRARAVILASGMQDKLPALSWIEDAIACGAVRLCAICDAYEASDLRIGVYGPRAVIGSHARFLRGYSEQVFVIPCDADSMDADDELPGLTVLPGGGELTFDGARCGYRDPAGATTPLDTIYPYLGSVTTAPLAASVGAELSAANEILVDAHQMTRVRGLYAIGDVVSGLNQISVAVGHAAIAATHLHNDLPAAIRTSRS
jgi:thioredoxin reductase (NADPH)